MPTTVFRGATPSPRYRLAAAMPHAIVGPTPARVLYDPTKLSFWGNNQYRDCVTAEEAFAKACHDPTIFIPDQEVEAWAEQHNVLNGASLVDVLDLMMTQGFKQNGHTDDDGPHSAVNWTSPAVLQNAIAHGPVKLGIAANQLEPVWQAHPTNGWFATGFKDDNNEDHCVSLCGYGTFAWLASELKVQVPPHLGGATPGYAMFTWDTIGIIDHPSMLAITHEAWLRNPTTVIK